MSRSKNRKPGHVYIATNPSMPGLVKVGFATDPETRMAELHTTGVPTPFELAWKSNPVRDMATAESRLHEKLQPHRLARDREFFELSLEAAMAAAVDVCAEFEDPVHLQIREELKAAEAAVEASLAAFAEWNRRPEVVTDRDALRNLLSGLAHPPSSLATNLGFACGGVFVIAGVMILMMGVLVPLVLVLVLAIVAGGLAASAESKAYAAWRCKVLSEAKPIFQRLRQSSPSPELESRLERAEGRLDILRRRVPILSDAKLANEVRQVSSDPLPSSMWPDGPRSLESLMNKHDVRRLRAYVQRPDGYLNWKRERDERRSE